MPPIRVSVVASVTRPAGAGRVGKQSGHAHALAFTGGGMGMGMGMGMASRSKRQACIQGQAKVLCAPTLGSSHRDTYA